MCRFNSFNELHEYFNELHNCENDVERDEYRKAVEYELNMRKLREIFKETL